MITAASVAFIAEMTGFSSVLSREKAKTAENTVKINVIDKMEGLSEFFIKHLITIKIIVIFAKNPINIQHLHFSMEVWYNI